MGKKTLIIGFSGKKGSGKSTAANVLVEHFGAVEFAFAEPLKRFCIDTLGLTREQCYGTDEQKNSLTKYKWENFPDYNSTIAEPAYKARTHPPRGLMTGRQIMQHWADVLKRQDPNIFLNAFIKSVREASPALAVVSDCRFVPETMAILDESSENIVIRLDRVIDSNDLHVSETELDNFEHSRYVRIANQNFSENQLISYIRNFYRGWNTV
jgi:hypothetical protein